MADKIAENVPPVLYKYREWTDNTNTENMLKEDEFYFASPKSFNDPFDCKVEPTFPRTQAEFFDRTAEFRAILNPRYSYDEHRRQLQRGFVKNKRSKKKIMDDFIKRFYEHQDMCSGILSFAANPFNGLMWSHYADSHKGICAAFLRRF